MLDVEISQPQCDVEGPLPASQWLDRITTGWRPLRAQRGQHGWIDERYNAHVIHEVFRDYGYSHALAFAAIVNAWAESALDNTAVMDTPFAYNGKRYPRGSGAIGLFQLLPSSSGAGGPSGPEQGYRRTFRGGRYAGNRWQARHYHDEPDSRTRRYYDATDPRTNTERIVLELERDGKRIVQADARGASIAQLAYLFGRDIERPQSSTWYRRKLAADMLGEELAWAKNPNTTLFAPEVDPLEELEALEQRESSQPTTVEPIDLVTRRPPVQAGLPPALGGLMFLLMLLVSWSEAHVWGAKPGSGRR